MRSEFIPFAAYAFHQTEMFYLVYVKVQKLSSLLTYVAAHLEASGQ